MRSELNIIRRDLLEYRKPLLALVGIMLLLPFVTGRSPDFVKGAVSGLMIGASYGFAQMCFITERQRRTLDLLLSLPIRPFRLAVAKYGSVIAMSLLFVNVPGFWLLGWKDLYVANAISIFFAALCMTPSVVSDKPWAPQLPLWIAVALFPFAPSLARWWTGSAVVVRAVAAHPLITATALLAVTGMAVLAAAFHFDRSSVS
jgi:ABC-type Na+ efflux pump permease subunit